MYKNKKTIYIYASDPVEQHAFIVSAKDRGNDVLLMQGPLDTHVVNYLEQKLDNSMFVRADATTADSNNAAAYKIISQSGHLSIVHCQLPVMMKYLYYSPG